MDFELVHANFIGKNKNFIIRFKICLKIDEKTQKIIVKQNGKEIFSETTDIDSTVTIKL